MVIGISIDEVVRDLSGSILKVLNIEYDNLSLLQKIDVFNLETELSFLKKEEIIRILFADYIMDIFAFCGTKEKTISNDIMNFMEMVNKHEIIFLSKENEKTIPPTLFFLGNSGIPVRNISLVEKDEDYWEKCDVLITASSKVLELKPEDKVGIKYLSDYNLNTESNYEITKFSDLFNIDFLTNNE
jgi:hypothetical protein